MKLSWLESENDKVTDDLYISKDGKTLIFMNRFPRKTKLYKLSDPHKEVQPVHPDFVFYHTFIGDDAVQAKEVIRKFDKKKSKKKIILVREDSGCLSTYGKGRTVTHLLNNQECLKPMLPKYCLTKEVFIVPLNNYYYQCPICHQFTLPERGDWDICEECGWEDEGIMAAEGTEMETYRKHYAELKSKDPGYHWYREFRKK